MAGTQPHYASASLYVGDLAPDVNETTLYEVFSAIGPVASIRVCRETGTRHSLGYAYVNYHSISDAERSLDTLNYTLIKGVPCRIMWCHRDPSLRRSGAGNIYVKNLDKIIDNKALHDTFSLFGNILSCKVAIDEYGKSKGYGFVHYESEQSAKNAIEKVNGMQIGSKTVYVGPFKKQTERPDSRGNHFTNLYVKQFPQEWTEDVLKKLFSPYGSITSMVMNTDPKGRRFALVNFEEASAAKAAVDELHGRKTTTDGVGEPDDEQATAFAEDVKTDDEKSEDESSTLNKERTEECEAKEESEKEESQSTKDKEDKTSDKKSTGSTVPEADKEPSVNAEGQQQPSATARSAAVEPSAVSEDRLYVQRAMTKAERVALLRETFNSSKEAKNKALGVNLYVKNLDDQVTDDILRETFSKYGTVTSAKVMRDDSGVSKGFGFVCFAFPEEATKAVTAMHLKIFHSKPLYVGLAERREQRLARLQQRYRMSNPRTGVPPHMLMMGGQPGVTPPQMLPYGMPNAAQQPMYYGSHGVPGGARAPVPGGYEPPVAWRRGQQMPGTTPSFPYPMSAMGPSVPSGSVPMRAGGGPAGQRMRNNGAMAGAGPSVIGPQQQNFKFTSQARNRQDYVHLQQPTAGQQTSHVLPMPQPSQIVQPQGGEGILAEVPLSAQALAAAHPQMQKQMLGERLFPLVHKHQPELAGKITGMMLEMDNAELLSLLSSEALLQAKVDEALGVLHRHHQGGAAPSLTSTSTTTGIAAAAPSQQGAAIPAVAPVLQQ